MYVYIMVESDHKYTAVI